MKNCKKIILTFVLIFILIGMVTFASAANTVSKEDLEEFITTQTSVDVNNITEADIITLYEELTEEYTNDELADLVESYSYELQKEGIDQDTINAGVTMLRTTDTEQLKEILQKDLNIDEIKDRLNKGEDIDMIVSDMQINPVSVGLKILLANTIVITFLYISAFVGLYMIVVRWLIYRKAGKHGWASIIPIYRDVVWLKIAGITPWVLLLWFIPIIGWISLALIMIVTKFQVAKAFGRSGWFGLGLWILPIIFESIIAFSKETKYIGDRD